jgi:hypothetical protein
MDDILIGWKRSAIVMIGATVAKWTWKAIKGNSITLITTILMMRRRGGDRRGQTDRTRLVHHHHRCHYGRLPQFRSISMLAIIPIITTKNGTHAHETRGGEEVVVMVAVLEYPKQSEVLVVHGNLRETPCARAIRRSHCPDTLRSF